MELSVKAARGPASNTNKNEVGGYLTNERKSATRQKIEEIEEELG